MRAFVLSALLLAAALAGCAEDELPPGPATGAQVSATMGAVAGVVVDAAITPVADIDVTLTGADLNRTTKTDADGRFVFDLVPPGAYFLRASHLLYESSQSSVEVVAGVDPPLTKVQVTPLFAQKPYHEQLKMSGFIQCGYQVPIVTAPCVTDYSTVVCPGGCVPPLRPTLQNIQGDHRYLNTSVSAGWQTLVLEMVWQANGQGTTDEMGMLLSYDGRTAGEWFGNVEGKSPLLLRFEVGELHESEQGDTRPLVNATGNDDLVILGSMKAKEGEEAGVGISQSFEVIQTTFYNAKPGADWSFVRGDEFPF